MKRSKQLPASREVEWVYLFAMKLAHERESGLDVHDLLAGIYLATLERLMRYWDEWERLEDFVVSECHLDQPRFYYWFDMCKMLRSDREEGFLEGLTSFRGEASVIVDEANGLAHENGSDETRIEHLLGAIASAQRSDLCKRFISTGMKVDLVRARMRRS